MNYKTHSENIYESPVEKRNSLRESFKLDMNEMDTLSANLYIGAAALLAPIIAMTVWFVALLTL
ncbi:hypothetical protein CL638_00045 [bacterium]|nr:hypothetical protein [bacterium]|tara:strand:+ start:292 stop:483 length:192 start_codon:yes stop_codon:yes gene_type:complete